MWCDFWLECLEKPEYNKIPIYNSVLRCFCIPDAVFLSSMCRNTSSWGLPNEGKFNYQFDINKPWKYGLLQASFDFPIYKNDLQVQKEQDSILADYQPYFQIDKEAEKMSFPN